MNTKTFESFKDIALAKEESTLFEHAAFSKDHHRKQEETQDHRLPYKRDVDRIVHSKAYARYIDKTQVVYLVDNDHITHRALHVQLVSNFSRGIAEILRLNLDLVEAISLGHDVGHAPFGHEGEGYLSSLALEYGGKVFAHPWQSCHLFSEIEPLNLGLKVLDGFLCHDGGMQANSFVPRFGKRWEDHQNDLDAKLAEPEKNIMPATLEGCLVKICDTMSYIGRDIEDAISLGIIHRNQVPITSLGIHNRDILKNLAQDIIQHSFEKPMISLSEESRRALQTLREFNFQEIYVHPKLKRESKKIERSYRILFEYLLSDFKNMGKNSFLFKEFLHNKPSKYIENTNPVQVVIDYISGMTDSFFVKTLQKVMVPMRFEIL
jgi:dGTPase